MFQKNVCKCEKFQKDRFHILVFWGIIYNFFYEFVNGDDEEVAGWQTICAFECRGCEVFEFLFSDGWNVKSTSGTEFDDVDLNDDWYDVDDNGEPVSITELEWQFVKVK